MINRLFVILICFAYASANGQNFDNLTFGTDSTLDVATWNIENFPKNGTITTQYVKDIIYALDLDYIAMQEVDNPAMFEEFIDQLDGYEGFYQENNYARLAVIYKTDVFTVNSIHQIFTAPAYSNPFPRPPIVMDVEFMGERYILINNHWKCCGDGYLDLNNPNDQENRRWQASNLLKDFMDSSYPDANIIMFGDLNDELIDPPAHNVFQNFIDDYENYRFVDMEIAQGTLLGWSYPSWPSHLDHILVSNELFDEVYNENSEVACIKLDNYFTGGWNAYKSHVSDHRPVALKFKPNNVGVRVEPPILSKIYFHNYPNPARDFTIFEWDEYLEDVSKMVLYNLTGQVVDEIAIAPGVRHVEVKINLNSGIYLVQLHTKRGVAATKKMVVY